MSSDEVNWDDDKERNWIDGRTDPVTEGCKLRAFWAGAQKDLHLTDTLCESYVNHLSIL